MLLQTDGRRTGGKSVLEDEETIDKVFEEESSDKLKSVKCYIKEVNNNREEETKEEPKHLLMNEKVESSDQTKLSR